MARPPRGERPLAKIAMTMDPEMLEAIDALVATMQTTLPFGRVGRSEVLREILETGWPQVQAKYATTRPQRTRKAG